MSERPHIVVFNPDQWRGDVLGHMGNPAALTPSLDRVVRTHVCAQLGVHTGTPLPRIAQQTIWRTHVI